MSDIENTNSGQKPSKLYDMRDLYGNPNFEIVEAIKSIDQLTNVEPSVIGIAPYGSTGKGYFLEGSSDLDLRILWDSSKIEKGTSLGKLQEVHRLVKEAISKVPSLEGRDVSIIEQDLNPKLLIPDIHSDHPEIGTIIAPHLAPLCRLVTGDKVDEYRRIYSKELNKLSPDRKTAILNGILNYFEAEDKMGQYKTMDRTGMSEENFQATIARRKELWKKRIEQIFN